MKAVSVILALLVVGTVFAVLQWVNPSLYGIDSYYHVKMAQVISTEGAHHAFPWARFSVFQTSFADKDFLFHVLTIPFVYLYDSFLLQAKSASLFFILLFCAVFIICLRPYFQGPFLALGILSLVAGDIFILYSLYLRPMVFVNVLVLILVVSALRRQWPAVFIVSALYALSHISFPLAVILVWCIEGVRYLYTRQVDMRNCLYVLLGVFTGCMLHPDLPHNLYVLYLNGILVPFYTLSGSLDLDFGTEFHALTTKKYVISMLPVLCGLVAFLAGGFFKKIRIRLHTCVFFVVFCAFFVLSLFSMRYVYHAYPFGIIFVFSFLSERYEQINRKSKTLVIAVSSLVLCVSMFFTFASPGSVRKEASFWMQLNGHYERVAKFMARSVPAGKAIFHAFWSDSPYFICLNPKDRYLVVLDPIYMYAYSKDLYRAYRYATRARIDVYRVFTEVFGTQYVYANSRSDLYEALLADPERFQVLFKEDMGAVFRVKDAGDAPESGEEDKA